MKSLSDVVGGSGLQGWAELALIIFVAVFIAVVLRVIVARDRELDRAARLPLDDDADITSHSSFGSGGTP